MGIPKDAQFKQLIVSDSKGFDTAPTTKTEKDGILSLTMSRNTGYVLRYDSFEATTDEEFWSDNFFGFD